MQTNSRRAVIATALAGLAAGCAPIGARAATPADADLIRLGKEFDRAEAEVLSLWREWRRCEALWRETIAARGLSFEKSEAAVWAVHKEVGATAASDANDASLDHLDRIRDAIHAIKPTTIAGLAAWAKAARFDGVSNYERDKAPEDRDFQAAAILDFIDVLEAMAAQAVRS